MTKQEIDAFYKAEHNRITLAYMHGELSKEDFSFQHKSNWYQHEQALIREGYLAPLPVVPAKPVEQTLFEIEQSIVEIKALLNA